MEDPLHPSCKPNCNWRPQSRDDKQFHKNQVNATIVNTIRESAFNMLIEMSSNQINLNFWQKKFELMQRCQDRQRPEQFNMFFYFSTTLIIVPLFAQNFMFYFSKSNNMEKLFLYNIIYIYFTKIKIVATQKQIFCLTE